MAEARRIQLVDGGLKKLCRGLVGRKLGKALCLMAAQKMEENGKKEKTRPDQISAEEEGNKEIRAETWRDQSFLEQLSLFNI